MALSARRPAEYREQARLAVRAVRNVHLGPERAAPPQQIQLRTDDLPARLDEIRVEPAVLAGRYREIPAVDQHVDESMSRVHLTRHRTVGDRDRSLHRAGSGERVARDSCGSVIRRARVVAEDVAVVA